MQNLSLSDISDEIMQEAFGAPSKDIEKIKSVFNTVESQKDGLFACILTADRSFKAQNPVAKAADDLMLNGQEPTDVNYRNFVAIKRALKDLGYHSIEAAGTWTEDGIHTTAEPNLVVFGRGNALSSLEELAKKFNQDAVVYVGPETNYVKQLKGYDDKRSEYQTHLDFHPGHEETKDPQAQGPFTGTTGVPKKRFSTIRANTPEKRKAFEQGVLKNKGKIIKFTA